MHVCLRRRGKQKSSTFRLPFSRHKGPISTSTTWRSSTACRQTCHSWRRKPNTTYPQAVEMCWHEYPAAKMGSVWLRLAVSAWLLPWHPAEWRTQLLASPWRSSSSHFERKTWGSPRSNQVSATCKVCGTKAGSEDADSMSSGSESPSDSNKE